MGKLGKWEERDGELRKDESSAKPEMCGSEGFKQTEQKFWV